MIEAIYEATFSMLAHTHADNPTEAVGVVWDNGTITRLINERPAVRSFAVSESQLARVFEATPTDLHLVALYHSHTNNNPNLSARDTECMEEWVGRNLIFPWVIATPDNHIYVWRWDEFTCQPISNYEWEYEGVLADAI